MDEKSLLKAQRAWVRKHYGAEVAKTLRLKRVYGTQSPHVSVVSELGGSVPGEVWSHTYYGLPRHQLRVGKAAGPGESWVYPDWVKLPTPRALLDEGTRVLCTGLIRHALHQCEVLHAHVKIAGATPRAWAKYRLRCVDEECAWPRREFSEEIGGQRRMQLVELPVPLEQIALERNTEIRRALIRMYGEEAYLRDAGATLVSQDDWGRLWRLEQSGEEPLMMVEMVNSTPEPDGSYRRYFERVPPTVRTPLEALAWQADLPVSVYASIDVQT